MEDCPNCTLIVNPLTEWHQCHPDLPDRLRQSCPFCRHHLRYLPETPENVAKIKKPTPETSVVIGQPVKDSTLFDTL